MLRTVPGATGLDAGSSMRNPVALMSSVCPPMYRALVGSKTLIGRCWLIRSPRRRSLEPERIVDALNFPASKCGPVKTQWIQVYPPNQTTPIFLGYKTTACSKPVRILSVSVVQPGSGGSA